MPYVELGKRLRIAREKAGMTQVELARKIRMSRTSVSNIEAGRQGISVAALYAIAAAIGVEPSEVMPPLSRHRASGAISASALDAEPAATQAFVRAVATAAEKG